MKAGTYLYTFLSLAYALPSSRKPHLIFRSGTLENATPFANDDLDLFASNIRPLASPELPEGLDITSTGTDNSAILNDPLGSPSNPQNLFDDSLSSAGVPEPTELLCLDNCPDSSIPLGLDLDDKNLFGADLDSGGIFIPPDDPLGIGPGTWIEVHRGSGRKDEGGSIPISMEINKDERQRGSGGATFTDGNGLGNDMLFSANDPVPVV